MQKRRKSIKQSQKKKVVARPMITAKRVMAFFAVPPLDHAVRMMTKKILREIPCSSCDRLLIQKQNISSAVKKIIRQKTQTAPATKKQEIQTSPRIFDPSVYSTAFGLTGTPILSSDVVRLGSMPAPSSEHLLSLPKATDDAGRNRKIRKPFLLPGELPELRHLSAKTATEFFLPSLQERLRLHAALPQGFADMGKEVAEHTLGAVDTVTEPLRRATRALPRVTGVHDIKEDVLPVPVNPVLPKTIAWASGVPKNLPLAPEVFPELEEEVPLFAPAPLRVSLLERWEAVHGALLGALRSPAKPLGSAVSFLLLVSIVILAPLGAISLAARGEQTQEVVVNSSARGLAALFSGSKAAATKNPGEAAVEFSQASLSFSAARGALLRDAGALKTVAGALPVIGTTVRAADALLAAAESLSNAGSTIASALQNGQMDLLSLIDVLAKTARDAGPDIGRADDLLQRVNLSTIPETYQETLFTLRDNIHAASRAFDSFPERAEALSQILGRDTEKRYLLVFQNSNELRPSGGFIGSIAEVTIDKGIVKEVRVPPGGSYDQQGDLRVRLVPPAPLLRVTGQWRFQDANWFADFPTTAQKLAWFYQKGGGPSVDGVIAITSELLPSLLKITGPISMPAYGRTFTAENVISETQHIVEVEYDRTENAPKKIIGELMGEVMTRMQQLSTEKMVAAGELFIEALRTKTIQVSFFDEQIQGVADASRWTGRLAQTDADVLRIVDTNIGGGKTDGVVSKTATIDAEIATDGSVLHTVALTYRHTGLASDVLSGGLYRDYLRLYVPEGSVLVSAEGNFHEPDLREFDRQDPEFDQDADIAASVGSAQPGDRGTDVWQESNRTVFGHWLTIQPGEEAVLRFVYRTPAKTNPSSFLTSLVHADSQSYRFLLEKQPGAVMKTTVHLYPPASFKSVWESADVAADSGSPTLLEADRFYAALYQLQ